MKHSIKRIKTSEKTLEKRRKVEAKLIKEYQDLMATTFKQRETHVQDKDAFGVTTELLTRNPENYTVWNIRREIMKDGLLPNMSDEERKELITGDLIFVQSKLKTFPKTYWLWNHRGWCLDQDKSANWDQELQLVNYLLEKDPRNFHGWHYRRYVIQKLEEVSQTSLAEQEFKYTSSKINANFSNYSAWHNRSKLIPKYLKEFSGIERREFLKSEIEYSTQAIYTDPDDQSAWLYHQWLVMSTREIVPDFSDLEIYELISSQIKAVAELYEVEPDSKNCMFFLATYLFYCKTATNAIPEIALSCSELISNLKETDPMRKNMYTYYGKIMEV